MTDLKRRQTLKTLTTGAIALGGFSLGTLSSAAMAADDRDIELEVHYSASGATDTLVMRNPSSKDVEVAMQFAGDIPVPGGQLDVGKLMQNGPVKIGAGETRRFDLARADRSAVASLTMTAGGHQSLRFPVSDNVIIDNIALISDSVYHSNQVPLLMRKVV